MTEIVLIYSGKLSTTSHIKMKFDYRRKFREQLAKYQKHMLEDGAPLEMTFRPEDRKVVGDFIFYPLITKESRRVVDLDITLLSDCEPGCRLSHPTGDLDNYLKSMIDGLRMAQTMNEIRSEKTKEGENPFYCLLEDDQQIRKINIQHHKNYTRTGKQTKAANSEVFAMIKVSVCEKYFY